MYAIKEKILITNIANCKLLFMFNVYNYFRVSAIIIVLVLGYYRYYTVNKTAARTLKK